MKLLSIVLILLHILCSAQAKDSYSSQDDRDLIIKKIHLQYAHDNINGIYARPLFEHLKEIVEADRFWDASFSPVPSKKIEIPDYEDYPKEVISITKTNSANALLDLQINKSLSGVSLKLSLFGSSNGKILLLERSNNFKDFDLAKLKNEVTRLYVGLKNQLPFRGYVLSRQGQQITFNMGAKSGLKPGSEILLVQILKMNRHPKLHFMVSSEKEIMGKAVVTKVDDNLSFASLSFEKEPLTIDKGSKVVPENYIEYQAPIVSENGEVLTGTENNPGDHLFFGKSPKEWVPDGPPQFGKIGFQAGIGQYNQVATISGGSYNIANSSSLIPYLPLLQLNSELWINPLWIIGFNTRQSSFAVSNPRSGSAPDKLMISMSQYNLFGAYNLLLRERDFFGPRFQVSLGLHNSNFAADNGSPTAITSMSYGGLYLGLSGALNIFEQIPFDIGAKYIYFLTKSLTENPSSGASSSSNINKFEIFGSYRTQTRFNWTGSLNVEYYSSGFSGAGSRGQSTTNVSHKLTLLMFGFEYLY